MDSVECGLPGPLPEVRGADLHRVWIEHEGGPGVRGCLLQHRASGQGSHRSLVHADPDQREGDRGSGGLYRYRPPTETAHRPEFYTFLELTPATNTHKVLISVRTGMSNRGFGVVKGFGFGTLQLKFTAE